MLTGAPEASLLDVDMTAMTLAPRAFYYTAEKFAQDITRRGLVEQNFAMSIVNGEAPLDPAVLVSCMKYASVADPADPAIANQMRWVDRWSEFIRPLDSELGYFIVTGADSFNMTYPGTPYTPGGGFTGNVVLTTAAVPAVPAAASGTIVAPGEFLDQAMLALAAAIKGDSWLKQVEAAG